MKEKANAVFETGIDVMFDLTFADADFGRGRLHLIWKAVQSFLCVSLCDLGLVLVAAEVMGERNWVVQLYPGSFDGIPSFLQFCTSERSLLPRADEGYQP